MADAGSIAAIDTSFETDTVFAVRADARSFVLEEVPVDPPVRKSFAFDPAAALEHRQRAWVALAGERVVGAVALQLEHWNHRAAIRHLYVDPSHRRQGVARQLLATALRHAREDGAAVAWVETPSVNVPAVRAYERLGFELCGVDTSLYEGTQAAGETALFMCKRLS